jgi:uncharacterized protein YdaU (DUF1376 family)
MAREKNPAFQFYPKDWLTDDKVQAMSLSERGLYITLLCHAWLHGSIPDTELVLSRITNVRRDLFKRLWKGQLKSCFITSSVGRLINPRLERERAKQAFFRELRAAAGRRGGETRQAKLKQPVDGFVQAKGQAKSRYAFPYSSNNPPIVPPAGGRPLTRDEKQHAERVLKNRFGRCHHHPRCPDHATCVERLVAELREKRKASR